MGIDVIARRLSKYIFPLQARLQILCILALLSLPILGATAEDDVVVLKDGRSFTGTILKREKKYVELECEVGGLLTTLRFTHHAILRLEIDGKVIELGAPDPPVPDRQQPKRKLAYAVVPLHGTFGEEIHADVVRDTFDRVRKTTECIVLDIDSNGGFLAEARRIVEVMGEYDDRFVYVALVRKGLSASILPIFACERVLLLPGGRMGAAVSYISNPATGSKEVDAKFNSALAAEVASLAAQHGWNPDIAKAMIVQNEVLMEWRDDQGQLQLGVDAPNGARDIRVVDDETQVLTISTTEAAAWGFPTLLYSSIDADKLGTVIAPDQRWVRSSRYGIMCHERAVGAWKEFAIAYPGQVALAGTIKANITDAYAADPDRFTYEWRQHTYWTEATLTWTTVRVPTATAWSRWYGSTDAALAAWRRAAQGLDFLSRVDGLAEYYFKPRRFDYQELQDEYRRCVEEIERLAANRSRGPAVP